MMTSNNNKSFIDFEKFRNIIKSYIDRHHYLAAEFWANKLVSLGESQPVDVYNLAQCYYLTRQYHRAILLLTSHSLLKIPKCLYLAARCHYDAGEYQIALNILEQNDNSIKNNNKTNPKKSEFSDFEEVTSIQASLHLLKGYIQEAVDNRTLAIECFKSALRCDPFCYEAFHALTQHNMLPTQEEKQLLSNIQLCDSSNEENETSLLKVVYETQLNKYSGVKHKLSPPLVAFEGNLDFITADAEVLYYQCDFSRSFKLTQKVLQKDPYHPQCLLIHIACLVELNQSNELFLLGHKLVDFYPEYSLSWFAVGCYYYLIGKYDHARRFLSKATTLDRVLGPAWIAYGHAFAAENEHDQARAAYYKAAQLMQGCHLPLLYIGMEYSSTNNSKFAEKFFNQALEISPNDPFIHHELGVVAFTNNDYAKAETFFRKAISVLEENSISVMPEKWATLLQNLGQTYCKLAQYDKALDFLQQALRVCPASASTYAALGLVQSYLGDYLEAIETLHKGLSLQKDHTVAASLLSTLMNHVVNAGSNEEEEPFEVIPTDSSASRKATNSSATKTSAPKLDQSTIDDDDFKNILGCSIGKPVMHSSDINNQTTRSRSSISADSSAMLVEDMEMDDESP